VRESTRGGYPVIGDPPNNNIPWFLSDVCVCHATLLQRRQPLSSTSLRTVLYELSAQHVLSVDTSIVYNACQRPVFLFPNKHLVSMRLATSDMLGARTAGRAVSSLCLLKVSQSRGLRCATGEQRGGNGTTTLFVSYLSVLMFVSFQVRFQVYGDLTILMFVQLFNELFLGQS
jgi:hypothetical protein